MSETQWHAIGATAAVEEGAITVHRLNGWQVLVARSNGTIHAVNDRCTHQAARLSSGRVRRGAVLCPLHGARFDLSDGRCIGGTYPVLRKFAVREADGVVEVEVPVTPPGMEDLPIPGV